MTSTEAFFTNSSEAFERRVVTENRVTPEEDVDQVYETFRCKTWIQEGKYTRVALQFPDELMCNSVSVASRLQSLLSPDLSIFILGDTSYGSCCVDEVAAQHYNADCIIHYGRSCLSSTCGLPVLYVFGSLPVDVEDCVLGFSELFPDTKQQVILMYDTVYAHLIEIISQSLKDRYKNLVISRLIIPNGKDSPETENKDSDETLSGSLKLSRCRRAVYLPEGHQLDSYVVFYVGEESLTLTNLMLTFRECPFYSYNPVTAVGRKESLQVNKALMKRYFMVEKAKDAQIVGILIGTLGVSNYLEILSRLKSLLKLAGKKCYTFVVGKINVPKLANFMEVDIFVLIACSENSLLDSSEFYKPIVTPYEMELACNTSRQWSGDYPTDFSQLLPGGEHHVQLPDHIDQEEITDVSLITGKLRRTGQSDVPLETGTAVISRDDALHVAVQAENAGEFLKQRSWRGLEQKLGETPVTVAQEGTSGIAMTYKHESATN